MYLDFFNNMVCYCGYQKLFFDCNLIFSRVYICGKVVCVDNSIFVIDVGGPFYVRVNRKRITFSFSSIGSDLRCFLGRYLVVSLPKNSSFSLSNVNSFLFFSNQVRKKEFGIFLQNILFFSNFFFYRNLFSFRILKWFRYRRRVWMGLAGLKVLSK